MTKERDQTIDLLRVIGMLLILFAHTKVEGLPFNLRQFDVVLLVIVSGMTFSYSSFVYSSENYRRYIRHRFYKLVIKTWNFLIVFMIFYIGVFRQDIPVMQIPNSFLLLHNGIGYVWVFRIMMINSLLYPFLRPLVQKIKPTYLILIVVVLLIVNDTIYLTFLKDSRHILLRILIYLGTYTVSYGCAAALGLQFTSMKKRDYALLLVIFGGITLFYINQTKGLDLDAYKYPPQMFYMSYGIFCSTILYLLVRLLPKLEGKLWNAITWFSSETLNIYLWHIGLVYLFQLEIIPEPKSIFLQFLALTIIPTICQVFGRKWITRFREKWSLQ